MNRVFVVVMKSEIGDRYVSANQYSCSVKIFSTKPLAQAFVDSYKNTDQCEIIETVMDGNNPNDSVYIGVEG